ASNAILALRHALLFPITEDSFITKLILSPAKNAAVFFFFIPCDQLPFLTEFNAEKPLFW
ncbi:MAG: hypothetical protein KJ822_11245, partial [Proteobacteria bacterium]|nr:hypothetical protein [Pseudomonadota bacterium]